MAGPTGSAGAAGSQGAPGPQGIPGNGGAQGIPGPRGPQGDAGAASTLPGPTGSGGPQGAAGPQGALGPQGDVGSRGFDSTVPGPQGSTGPRGEAGPAGSPGAQGDPGDPGMIWRGAWTAVAYQPHDVVEYAGSSWIAEAETSSANLPGDGAPWALVAASATDSGSGSGIPGPTGPQGPAGSQGMSGPQGSSVTGAQGGVGPQGASGPQGVSGSQGAQGAFGPTGPQGAAGQAGTAGPTGLQGIAGAAGDPGDPGIRWMGEWTASAYQPGDAVSRNGSSYIAAIETSSANDPADGYPWDLLAAGSSGDLPGPTGPAGPASTIPGPTGPAGAQGVAGATGVTGAAGIAGGSGATGPQGPFGPQGVAGASVTGSQGAAGPQGAPGPTGSAGSGGSTSTFSDAAFRIAAASDSTRAVAFDLSGVASGVTRTLTVPNASTVIVGTTAQQSLTSKILLAADSGTSPLHVRAVASQSAPLAVFMSSGGAELLRIDSDDPTNTWVGASAGAANTPSSGAGEGIRNTALGAGALAANETGASNTAVGAGALSSVTSGNGNIALGANAGDQLLYGSSNIAIGSAAQVFNPTGDQQLSIGNLIYGTGLDGSGSNVSSGNIGIGTDDPTARLDVSGSVRLRGLGPAGTLSVDASGNVSAGGPSDATLKRNVEPLAQGLALVVALRPIRFDWTAAANMGDTRQIGFLADEVEAILPELVTRRPDGIRTLDYPKLTAVLAAAMQEMDATHRATMAVLIERIVALESAVAANSPQA